MCSFLSLLYLSNSTASYLTFFYFNKIISILTFKDLVFFFFLFCLVSECRREDGGVFPFWVVFGGHNDRQENWR